MEVWGETTPGEEMSESVSALKGILTGTSSDSLMSFGDSGAGLVGGGVSMCEGSSVTASGIVVVVIVWGAIGVTSGVVVVWGAVVVTSDVVVWGAVVVTSGVVIAV